MACSLGSLCKRSILSGNKQQERAGWRSDRHAGAFCLFDTLTVLHASASIFHKFALSLSEITFNPVCPQQGSLEWHQKARNLPLQMSYDYALQPYCLIVDYSAILRSLAKPLPLQLRAARQPLEASWEKGIFSPCPLPLQSRWWVSSHQCRQFCQWRAKGLHGWPHGPTRRLGSSSEDPTPAPNAPDAGTGVKIFKVKNKHPTIGWAAATSSSM